MSPASVEQSTSPPAQYLQPEHVMQEMGQSGHRNVRARTAMQVFVLAVLGGGFITLGALFSLLLAQGIGAPGPKLLVEGFGFAAGFTMVVLSHAVLFTEANVALPASLLACERDEHLRGVLRFWGLAWIGNFIGALLVGWTVSQVQFYPDTLHHELQGVIQHKKMEYRAAGGLAWVQIVFSGMLANWMVGMAAVFAVMGRTIVGKYVPMLLAVSLMIAANFQHSPANMGYFALATPLGIGPGWPVAFLWNIIPAGIGNILGGGLLVALPFWYALHSPDS